MIHHGPNRDSQSQGSCRDSSSVSLCNIVNQAVVHRGLCRDLLRNALCSIMSHIVMHQRLWSIDCYVVIHNGLSCNPPSATTWSTKDQGSHDGSRCNHRWITHDQWWITTWSLVDQDVTYRPQRVHSRLQCDSYWITTWPMVNHDLSADGLWHMITSDRSRRDLQ